MNKISNQVPDDSSVKEVLFKYKGTLLYLKSKWTNIVLCGITGAILGLIYSNFKKNSYTATSTFVLEESKGGALNQYAGLASLAGIDLGSGGGGVFAGDNIIELYKSRAMIKKALLSEITINSKKQLLIDRYIDYLNLKEKWNKSGLGPIKFNTPPESFNREQDSIITDIVDNINKKVLNVNKPDKKLIIIQVEVKFADELFSKEFNNQLVENVNEFYVGTKTKKNSNNVAVLQKQVDSIRTILNSSIGGVASAVDATPNANPYQTFLKVSSQKKQIDVQANTAIYAEMVKNLELAKISLRQEMPLIQMIDAPVYPLPVEKLGKIRAVLSGFFGGMLLCSFVLVLKRYFGTLLK